ncbi:Copine 9 [Fasciola gigantica]|uniref:Copine 9 n=1 Tax=Fasciola gigantica TaxID=46835 RepID=A0A504YZX3_FASGI|nr:Copine 9 [Fasciola gigantica]
MQSRPRIQIGISCRGLKLLKYHKYQSLGFSQAINSIYKHVTETELQNNIASPIFVTRLNLEYYFEEKQIITAEIFQCEQEDREDSHLLGFVQCTVGRVIHSGGQVEQPLISDEQQKKYLKHADPSMPTTVVVCIREDPFYKENICLKMQGFNLDKKDFFGKSDPYVTIYRRNERGKLQKCCRSEVIKNTLFPDFRPIPICLDKLCGGNIDCELYFRCFAGGGRVRTSEEVDTELDDLIGEFTTTVSDLLRADENGLEFKVRSSKKQFANKSVYPMGLLNVKLYFAQTKYSFLDYIFGGTSINVVVGVDLSNHAAAAQLSKTRQIEMAQSCNEYGVAIQAVMEILQEYDSDQLFPAFGFGSKLSTGGKICNKYPLSGDANNYFCKGMAGVLEAYRRSFDVLHLAGPVCFSPIVRDVSETAKRNKDAENYYVLLILTNGTVDDWIETKKAVIEASFLPISIIVIGIGGGNFSDMEILDQDFGLLKVGQEQACRDNVQFVQMRRFLRMAADGTDNLRWSKVALAKEVLAELPSQMMDYFERSHLAPSHTVPGQPRLLRNLADPIWWRQFTQPFPSPVRGERNTSSETKQSGMDTGRLLEELEEDQLDHPQSVVPAVQAPATQSKPLPDADPSYRLGERLTSNAHLAGVRCLSASLVGESSGPPRSTHRVPSVKSDDTNTTSKDRGNPFPHVRRQMSLGPAFHSSTSGRKLPGTYEQVSRKPSTSEK